MKNLLIGIMQVLFGYENYLFFFSCLKIYFLRFDNRKKDYLGFLKMISPGSIVLVIGANTGITTVPVAKNLSQGKIFAFEPVQQNINVMRRVLRFFRLENNVTVFQTALGNYRGKLKMILPVWQFTKKHGYAHAVENDNASNEKGFSFTIDVIPLDEIPELKNVKVDFIKIVAENYEYNILNGGKDLIQKNKPVIYCELWDNENRKKTLDLIVTLGYSIKVFRNGQISNYEAARDLKKYFLFFPN